MIQKWKVSTNFFHILGAVEQQKGCCNLGDGKYEITFYTSCCNTQKGIYYYTTYENHQICAVNMHHENLNCSRLIRYSPIQKSKFDFKINIFVINIKMSFNFTALK